MKKIIIIILTMILLSIFVGTKLYSSKSIEEDKSYGVFLSLDGSSIEKLEEYSTVVIDAEYYSKEQIDSLHNNGQTVYSYLNVGSIESFRDYYKDFSALSLGAYENWDEEEWIDVSDKGWQQHIEDISQEYIKKGVDGFFIDNCDVYYFNESEEIYNGVQDILKNLMKNNIPVIINGGDYFVEKYYEQNNRVNDIMTGINQETVFSSIDFDKNKLGKAKTSNKEYYLEYVEKYGELGLDIYLLEYTTDENIKKEVLEYCNDKGWKYYFSDSIELD